MNKNSYIMELQVHIEMKCQSLKQLKKLVVLEGGCSYTPEDGHF